MHHICPSLYVLSVWTFIPAWALLSTCSPFPCIQCLHNYGQLRACPSWPNLHYPLGCLSSLLLHHLWSSPPTIWSSRPMQPIISLSSSILPLHINQVIFKFILLLILGTAMLLSSESTISEENTDVSVYLLSPHFLFLLLIHSGLFANPWLLQWGCFCLPRCPAWTVAESAGGNAGQQDSKPPMNYYM